MRLPKTNVQIFSDGADKESMLRLAQCPEVKGITTNPSLMKKAGISDYKGFALDVLKDIKNLPISFEVFSDEFSEMHRQALEIKSWADNVYVKIPVTNSKGEWSIDLIRELSQAGVKLNVTAVFNIEQVTKVCEALKGGAPSYVSIFAGRIADTGVDPVPLMKESLEICRNHGEQIELLWASTREVYNIIQADEAGCDIITVPPSILDKFSSMHHRSPKQLSLETVQAFKKDSEIAGFEL